MRYVAQLCSANQSSYEFSASNIREHGKVSYQKPWLKSIVNAVHLRSAVYIAMY